MLHQYAIHDNKPNLEYESTTANRARVMILVAMGMRHTVFVLLIAALVSAQSYEHKAMSHGDPHQKTVLRRP